MLSEEKYNRITLIFYNPLAFCLRGFLFLNLSNFGHVRGGLPVLNVILTFIKSICYICGLYHFDICLFRKNCAQSLLIESPGRIKFDWRGIRTITWLRITTAIEKKKIPLKFKRIIPKRM